MLASSSSTSSARLRFVSFHLSPQFASVCLHCCTPICLPFASLFCLQPPCPTSLPPPSPLPAALSVCICACCWCCCCFCVHALFTAKHSFKIRTNQKKFRQFRKYFHATLLQFSLKFFYVFSFFVLFFTDFTALVCFAFRSAQVSKHNTLQSLATN